jgi:hypothetical protein
MILMIERTAEYESSVCKGESNEFGIVVVWHERCGWLSPPSIYHMHPLTFAPRQAAQQPVHLDRHLTAQPLHLCSIRMNIGWLQ